MSLDLDSRQRAMLAEMGLPVFEPLAIGKAIGKAIAPAPPVPPVPPAPPASAVRAAPAAPAVPKPAPTVRESKPLQNAPLQRRSDGIELMQWSQLAETVAACRACNLCSGRQNTVFGVGGQRADWLIVGDPPTEQEDLQGEPFVGQDGKLLDNMLKALGLTRGDKVYITNALKCRPPGNRNPQPEEVAQCEAYLRRQVELLAPKIILAMGRFAVQSLLASTEPIGRLRGRAHQYMGVPVVVTYHPVVLVRSPAGKAKAWADLCLAQSLMRP